MSDIAIVTDSIPEAMLQELNIHIVAYYIYRDEFLRWLPTDPGPALAGHSGAVFLSCSRMIYH